MNRKPWKKRPQFCAICGVKIECGPHLTEAVLRERIKRDPDACRVTLALLNRAKAA